MRTCVLVVPEFQSTPSVWRETPASIVKVYSGGNFNPLPPYGGRLSLRTRLYKLPYFNPLPPYGGRQKSRVSTIA